MKSLTELHSYIMDVRRVITFTKQDSSPKNYFLFLFSHPQIVPNLYYFTVTVLLNTKYGILKNMGNQSSLGHRCLLQYSFYLHGSQ